MYEYKVITQRDRLFSGGFSAEVLQDVLNAHSALGWRVVQTFLATSVWKSMKTEIVVVLEREKAAEPAAV